MELTEEYTLSQDLTNSLHGISPRSEATLCCFIQICSPASFFALWHHFDALRNLGDVPCWHRGSTRTQCEGCHMCYNRDRVDTTTIIRTLLVAIVLRCADLFLSIQISSGSLRSSWKAPQDRDNVSVFRRLSHLRCRTATKCNPF